jgi:repressor LexA
MSSEKENQLTPKDLEVLRHIRNGLMHTGKSPSIRDIQKLMKYRSPRSVTVIMKRLFDKGVIERRGLRDIAITNEPEKNSYDALTVNVPLVGTASCGKPLLAEEHIQAMIPVSTELAIPPHKYFLLRANGDSMNEAGIENGDLVLVRQQSVANDGDAVVALIDSEATIKILQKEKEAVVLKPASRNKDYRPIILQRDFMVQGVVVKSLGRID